MLDHLSFQCADVEASAAFYETVLATIGGTPVLDFGEVIGYGVAPMRLQNGRGWGFATVRS